MKQVSISYNEENCLRMFKSLFIIEENSWLITSWKAECFERKQVLMFPHSSYLNWANVRHKSYQMKNKTIFYARHQQDNLEWNS